tara:strand:- start:34 stop:798 length:765 start_codon:yes stop_codon:yes gene_type:complete
MKSPLKDIRFKNLSRGFLKTAISPATRVSSYGIFSGHTELSLARQGTDIDCYTDKPVIYQFWECICESPYRLHSILTDKSFKFTDEREFAVLQETLPGYSDSYIRSSLFFLLNRYSKNGQVSCGEFCKDNFNPAALNQLKIFRKPKNFNVHRYDADLCEHVSGNTNADFVLFPNVSFKYNLFNIGKPVGYDTYQHNPAELKKILGLSNRPVAIVFNKHPGVFNFFKDFNQTLINSKGRLTEEKSNCEEIIVTNF